jgi:glycosyltransferase involved in cell wall biosynthesis
LNRGRFAVVVSLGWTIPNTVLALLNAKIHKRKIVLWDESIPHLPGRIKRLLMPLLRRYFAAFDAYLAASDACVEYMIGMGARRERIILMPQVADNAYFGSESARYREHRDSVKQELGVQTKYLFLFVGQLIPRKGVLTLLDAFRQVAADRSDVSLMFVGEGALRQELLARRRAYGLESRVLVCEYAPQVVLPKYYAAADVFCLASVYDTFGAVVSEAMACGLPVVTTKNVGATSNIVRDGVNGFVVDADRAESLAVALARLIGDDTLRAAMAVESRRIISDWSVERAAANFAKCIEMCLDRPTTAPIQQASLEPQ